MFVCVFQQNDQWSQLGSIIRRRKEPVKKREKYCGYIFNRDYEKKFLKVYINISAASVTRISKVKLGMRGNIGKKKSWEHPTKNIGNQNCGVGQTIVGILPVEFTIFIMQRSFSVSNIFDGTKKHT